MKTPKACIIIPTYNERENMPIILDRLLSVFSKISDYDMNILIVDDNSPDGTARVAEEYCKKHKNIHILNRKKKIGLGAAYIAGFNYVFDYIDADVVFQMDADLSHSPEKIPEFLKQITNGYNFVIGSRYIPGGGVVGWSIDRKITSKTGNLIARYIVGMRANDCTSGFRAITKLSKSDMKEFLISCLKMRFKR
jgi:dolichol-phosphate mannosyltransferase